MKLKHHQVEFAAKAFCQSADIPEREWNEWAIPIRDAIEAACVQGLVDGTVKEAPATGKAETEQDSFLRRLATEKLTAERDAYLRQRDEAIGEKNVLAERLGRLTHRFELRNGP